MSKICRLAFTDGSYKYLGFTFAEFLERFNPSEIKRIPDSLPDTWIITGKIKGRKFTGSMVKEIVTTLGVSK